MANPPPKKSLLRRALTLLLTIAIILAILVAISLLTSETGISDFIYDF